MMMVMAMIVAVPGTIAVMVAVPGIVAVAVMRVRHADQLAAGQR